MNFVSKKHIPRRAFLRGVGAAVSLPLLDSMIPAFAAVPKPIARMAFCYTPNGIIMQDWTPAKDGSDFEYTKTLKPLEPHRDKVLVLTGLATSAEGHADRPEHVLPSVADLPAHF